jgi:hypothetical protein
MPALTASERLDRAAEAWRDGRYAEALEHHVWFHENALAEDPALSAVRLSFGLRYWAELAKVYPPALDALRAARDRPRERLLAGTGRWEDFQEVDAVNEMLDEPEATHDLFRSLDLTQPELARECLGVALPVLVARGDHLLAWRHLGDPAAFVRRRAEIVAVTLKHEDEPTGRVREGVARRYADAVGMLLRVLVGVGEYDAARSARELALTAVEDAGLRDEVAAQLPTGVQYG